jgi:hypothetical protein
MSSVYSTVGSHGPTGAKIIPTYPASPHSVSQTVAGFVCPALNSSVAVAITDTSWMAVGAVIWVAEPAGYYQVMSITNSTHVVIKNLTDERPMVERSEIHESIGYDD